MTKLLDNNADPALLREIEEIKKRGAPPEAPPTIPRLDQIKDPRAEKFNNKISEEIGNKTASVEKPAGILSKETLDEIKKLEDDKFSKELKEESDLWVTDEYGNLVRNLLGSTKRRKAIEARCKPMNIRDLFLFQYVEQEVPIHPGEFSITFRSLSGRMDLFIKKLLAKEVGYNNKYSDRYIIDTWGLMQACAASVAINGEPQVDIRDENGKPNEELFNKKFEYFVNFPHELLANILVNYSWFSDRVKLLTNIDNITDF